MNIEQLKAEIYELGQAYSGLTNDELFTLWFLRAYLTESVQAAADAVVNGSKDKNIDAVLIDDTRKLAVIVQAKYRQRLNANTEKRNDVMEFAELARIIKSEDHAILRQFLSNIDPLVRDRVKQVHEKVHKRKYRLCLYYVTLGKCSSDIAKDACAIVHRVEPDFSMEVIDGKRVMLLFHDYLDGVAPPIPSLNLEMEKGQGVKVNAIMQRYDTRTGIESWVFSMNGDAVAQIFEFGGRRLFARNIRGFLGENTPVNSGMSTTLDKEPERFFFIIIMELQLSATEQNVGVPKEEIF